MYNFLNISEECLPPSPRSNNTTMGQPANRRHKAGKGRVFYAMDSLDRPAGLIRPEREYDHLSSTSVEVNGLLSPGYAVSACCEDGHSVQLSSSLPS